MKFDHQKYVYSRPFGHPRHHWEIVGPEGGVHLHVSLVEGYDASCGLEFHHTREAWKRITGGNDAPHHRECPVIGGPCWHDGTSLYAMETLWPHVKPYLKTGDHDAIFRILEREYVGRFEPKTDE